MTYSHKSSKSIAFLKGEAISKIISGKEMSDEEIFEKARKGDKSILKLPKKLFNIKDKFGSTPIHWLTRRGVKEVLNLPKELLMIQDNDGSTPIHYLAREGVKEILDLDKKFLIAKDNGGYTPIYYLAWTRVDIPDAYKQYI
jgi:ankyrin repeat protein